MLPLKHREDPAPDIAALLEDLRPRLRAFLLSLTGSESAADDLTQETCLVIWEKRDEFDPAGDFRAWAFRIGLYQAQNYRRKIARRASRELPADELFDEMAAIAIARHADSDRADAHRRAVVTCLKKLTTPHRELLLSRYHDGVSLEQLSRGEGINRNAMAQKLFRLKRKLLRCIEKDLSNLES